MRVVQISIHAPTRGATACRKVRAADTRHFNPRAHTGRDKMRVDEPFGNEAFQSTRPHGARRFAAHSIGGSSIFQSTRPHGARRRRQEKRRRYRHFNPPAHTGRDYTWRTRTRVTRNFNPRAHTGRDPPDSRSGCPRRHFNPRAHTGRDPSKVNPSRLLLPFQSTRPHGARP